MLQTNAELNSMSLISVCYYHFAFMYSSTNPFPSFPICYPNKGFCSFPSISLLGPSSRQVLVLCLDGKKGGKGRGRGGDWRENGGGDFPSTSCLCWWGNNLPCRREIEGSIFPPLQILLPSFLLTKQWISHLSNSLPSMSFQIPQSKHTMRVGSSCVNVSDEYFKCEEKGSTPLTLFFFCSKTASYYVVTFIRFFFDYGNQVFGEKFDAFAINFEKSFGSTLNTIRLVRSEINNGGNLVGNSHVSNSHLEKIPVISPGTGECSSRTDDVTEGCRASVNLRGASQCSKQNEDTQDHAASSYGNQELPMQGIVNWQLARSNPRSLSNHSMVTTIEKSLSEQARANDLKSVEISLMMKKMQMKEVELALNSDSNFLEKCKLSLGISRTSFKVEKFKTQVEETKHGELLKELADFLVTGLIIMSCCLCCGVYTFSLDNLRELTKSCYPPEGAKSWWKPMASLNLGWQTLSCQVQVYSRIIFGGLIIGAVAVTLIQRADIARQGMPITSIVLLLGLLGGFVGKICVDTLGGNGYTWLMFWEVLCLLHFFSITFTPVLYSILSGAVQVCQGAKYRILFPFWVRRCLFRLFLILLPVLCGLLPFASGKTWWEDHISIWVKNRWLATFAEPYDVGFHE